MQADSGIDCGPLIAAVSSANGTGENIGPSIGKMTPVDEVKQGVHTSDGGEESASEPHAKAPTGQRDRVLFAYATHHAPGEEREQGEGEKGQVDGRRQLV